RGGGGGGLDHRDRGAGEDRGDGGAETNALGRGREGRKHGEGIATGDLGRVDRVEPEPLGEPRSLDPALERAPRGDEGTDSGHAGPGLSDGRSGRAALSNGPRRRRAPAGGTLRRAM